MTLETLVARSFLQLPRPLRAAVIGRRHVVVDDQPLDRQLQLLLWAEARTKIPSLGAGTVADARARFRRTAPLLAPTPPRHDRADLHRKPAQPLLVLWGEQATMHKHFDVLETWRERADDVRGRVLPCGHYLPEEQPDAVFAEFMKFFGAEA